MLVDQESGKQIDLALVDRNTGKEINGRDHVIVAGPQADDATRGRIESMARLRMAANEARREAKQRLESAESTASGGKNPMDKGQESVSARKRSPSESVKRA